MVDLSKKEVNKEINNEVNQEVSKEEIKQVVKQEVQEQINQILLSNQAINQVVLDKKINQEVLSKQEVEQEVEQVVEQVVISKAEPTKEVNNVVCNVDFNEAVTNKQYDIIELIVLAFKLVNKNIGRLLMCLLWIALATFALLMPIAMTLDNIYSFNAGSVILVITMAILFSLWVTIFTWLADRTVTSIDTGIESIESKKSKSPIGATLWRLFSVQIIMLLLSFSIYTLAELTSKAVVIYIWIMIQVQIFSYLLNNCTWFANFEVLAKGENVSNSLANAFTNLFFSKNKIILKTIVGSLIFGLGSFVIIFAVVLFGTVLGGTIWPPLVLLLILFGSYALYFSTTYKYLVYMLNEVRDDKVDDLR